MFFDGIDLTPYFRIKAIRGRGLINRNINTVAVPGMDGEYPESVDTPSKNLEVDIRIISESLRETIDELNGILATDEPVQIIFPDEPDKTYYGMVQSSDETGDYVHLGWHDSTIIIRRSDPYKYGKELTALFPSDNVTLTNNGTAEADPIFEMEVLEPVTFAMIQNQNNEYQLIGIPAEDDVEVVDTKPLVLSERGGTLSEWGTTPILVDDALISNIDGSMTYDGTGIMAESFGTGTGMHGPAIIKELSSPIQDFEIETIFDIISNDKNDNYRMEVYFLDEGMNMLGKMGINDNNKNFIRRIGIARVGERVDSTTRYVIGQRNYQYDNLGEESLMYLRARRQGNRYTFYISEIRNAKHYVTIEESYIDTSGTYNGRLKYIELFIGNWGDRKRTFRTRINYVNVYELKQETVDQTPYIAYPGDLITFDHVNDELLLNGEDAKALKGSFGANYFKLHKGYNQLIVAPGGSFNTSVKYRERYR